MTGLTQSDIAKLLGVPTGDIEAEVKAKLEECIAKLKAEFVGPPGKDLVYPTPVVVFDLRGTTAGQAWGSDKIRLNIELLNSEYKDEMLAQTLPHEYAHIFVHANWPNAEAHGSHWKWIMIKLGLRPDRTHNMPVKKQRIHPRNFGYECPTHHKIYWLTSHRHNKMQNTGARYILACGCSISAKDWMHLREGN